ncbi:hypothetical protein HZS_962, partial [Henneguya salminicola]
MDAPRNNRMWIKNIWRTFSFQRRLLVWDDFRCHLTPRIKKTLKSTNNPMDCIPGGRTKLLQPAEVSWNAAFKAKYRELYDIWLQNDKRKTDKTQAGNPRAPSRIKLVNWVKEAWNMVSTDIIILSFDVCGIISSDPDIINCTKLEGVAEAARESLPINNINYDLNNSH